MQEIAEGIVVSSEFRRITVGAFATGAGLVCIDVPPFPADARRWRSQIQERFKQPIRLVILTDAQRDRLLGLHWFDEAVIVAHDATFQAMRALPGNFVDLSADLLAADSSERLSFAGVRLCYPRVSFSQRMTAYVQDVPLSLTAMPGPTPGNVWVHFEDQGIWFVGDSVVNGVAPYMARAQSKAWLDSLTFLRRPRSGADMIVPGRGPLTTREATLPLSEFLRYLRRRVQSFVRTERPRGELLELVPDVMGRLEHVLPAEREDVERRVRAGLESIYDEFLMEDIPLPDIIIQPPPEDDDNAAIEVAE
jgi:glyoxylase-like metal-dependent hydrolase (beta-lactamase superfamily II)